MMGRTLRKQVVAYIPPAMKEELTQWRAASGDSRDSESALVEECMVIAWPEMRKRYVGPTHEAPGKKRRSA